MPFVAGGKGVRTCHDSKKLYHLESCRVNIFMWRGERVSIPHFSDIAEALKWGRFRTWFRLESLGLPCCL